MIVIKEHDLKHAFKSATLKCLHDPKVQFHPLQHNNCTMRRATINAIENKDEIFYETHLFIATSMPSKFLCMHFHYNVMQVELCLITFLSSAQAFSP